MQKVLRLTLLLLTLQSFIGLVAAAELPTLDSPSTITGEPATAAGATAAIATVTRGFSGTTGHLTGASDPSIAVGDDRVVVISNSEVAVSTKSGELIDLKGLHLFFLPAIPQGVSSAGDVAAIFDDQSGRFFLAQNAQLYPQECKPGTCVGFNMLAVSKTSSPNSLGTSDWYFFAIDRFLDQTAEGPVATENGGDFDKLGVDEQHLIITSLQSRESDRAPAGPKIRLLDKAKLIAGEEPDTWVDVFPDEDSSLFLAGVTPARMYSESPVFFFAADAPRGYPCGFTVLGINTEEIFPAVTWSTASLEGNCASGDWAVEGAGRGPQLGGPPIAVAGTGFSTIPVFRDGRLWVAGRWQQDFGSGGVSVIRWAELDMSQWPDAVTVVQDGTIGEDKVWSFEPSLTVDSNGNLLIGYHTTGTDQYPAINVSARLASDPAGTMRPGIVVKAGTGSAERLANGRNRFADYSWMALDPVDETSWIHGQYGSSGLWETWVANIAVATPAPVNVAPAARIIQSSISPLFEHFYLKRAQLEGAAEDTDGVVIKTEWKVDGRLVGTGLSLEIDVADQPMHVAFVVTDDDGAVAIDERMLIDSRNQIFLIPVSPSNSSSSSIRVANESLRFIDTDNRNGEWISLIALETMETGRSAISIEWYGENGTVFLGQGRTLSIQAPDGISEYSVKVIDDLGASAEAFVLVTVEPKEVLSGVILPSSVVSTLRNVGSYNPASNEMHSCVVLRTRRGAFAGLFNVGSRLEVSEAGMFMNVVRAPAPSPGETSLEELAKDCSGNFQLNPDTGFSEYSDLFFVDGKLYRVSGQEVSSSPTIKVKISLALAE